MDHLLFMNSKTLFKVRSHDALAMLEHALTASCLCPLAPLQYQRKDPVGKNRLPVMVHVNYHPDKAREACMTALSHSCWILRGACACAPVLQWDRMKAVVRRWVDGDVKALDGFPDGSQ